VPVYEFLCDKCNKKTKKLLSIANHTNKIDCVGCGGEARQIFSVGAVIEDIKPFVTDHITGSPLLVKSRRQKKELLGRNGLAEAG
jgi:putative FmdB family regulatory protein